MSNPLIIDCHTHAYPRVIAGDPRTWAIARNEAHWADLVAPEGRPSIQGWSTISGMLEAMDASGVDQAVLQGWYWEHEATCRWHNEVMAEWMEASAGRLLGFAAILPNESVIKQLEAAESLGFRGVGELHIGVQGLGKNRKHWLEMLEWCTAHDWPICFHVTGAAGHEHPSAIPTPLVEFVHMAKAQPNLKIILAHWGGGLPFFEQNSNMRNILKNVFYDTAASPLLYELNIFKRIVEMVGRGKILYGSDFPLRLYPKQDKQPHMNRFLEQIRNESGLSESCIQSILGSNAALLFNNGNVL